MIHLTSQQLSASLDRELNEASESNLRDHLSGCADCASRLERLEDQEEKLIRTLWSDPGEAVFERIEREVDERTRPGARVSPPSRATVQEPMPRAVAQAPAARPTAHDSPSRPVEPERRMERTRTSFPGGIVTLVVAAAAGIGALTYGFAYAPRWLGASGAGDRTITATAAVVPAASDATGGVASVANDEPQPEPPPAEEAVPDGTPAIEPEQLQPAQPLPAQAQPRQPERAEGGRAPREPAEPRSTQVKVSGEASHVLVDFGAPEAVNAAGLQGPGLGAYASAPEYDAAADGWERVLGMLHGGEYRDGRQRLAEARYRAWQLEPTGERAARAAAALRAYMVVAPQGPDRESATRWLAEIGEGSFR